MIDKLAGLAKCPYYIRSAEYSISCEGLFPTQEISLRFPTGSAKWEFAKKHCMLLCSSCPIRLYLDALYDGIFPEAYYKQASQQNQLSGQPGYSAAVKRILARI